MFEPLEEICISNNGGHRGQKVIISDIYIYIYIFFRGSLKDPYGFRVENENVNI